MSASNWAVCPQCKIENNDLAERKDHMVRKSYGVIDSVKYEESVAEARAFRKSLENPESTLREDYRQGIDENGEYSVSYFGHCATCGLKFQFSHKENAL